MGKINNTRNYPLRTPVPDTKLVGSDPVNGNTYNYLVSAIAGDIAIRAYPSTDDVPTDEVNTFMFFVEDDDGNGPAMGFWDGENIQIIISVTI